MPENQWRRNNLRLPAYDYANFGAAFVIVCTHEHQPLFGDIANGEMQLSPAGIAVRDAWSALPKRFPHIGLDDFIVMPDHLHGVVITESAQPPEVRAVILGDTINSFKNIVLAAWRRGVGTERWPRYEEHLWQRAFYDRIIRDQRELEAIREYILGNPVRWEQKRRGYV